MRKLICLLALAMAVALGAGCAKMPVRGDYMQDTPPQIVPDQKAPWSIFCGRVPLPAAESPISFSKTTPRSAC